jgi:hypothetical protein
LEGVQIGISAADVDIQQVADNVTDAANSFDKFAGCLLSILASSRTLILCHIGRLFKILLGFAQVISTLAINLPTVPWPTELTNLWDAIGAFANLDIFGAVSFDCISAGFTFFDTFKVLHAPSCYLYPSPTYRLHR